MKYDFKKIKLVDLEGKAADKTVEKDIANALYAHSKDLGLVDKAIKIYKGESVELDKVELAEVTRIVNDDKLGFFAFVKKAYQDYIDSVKE